MAMLTNEIRERLTRYVAGDDTPEAFRHWFALILRDVHQSNDEEAETLAHQIEWQFLYAEQGKISCDVLKTNLSFLSKKHAEPNPVQILDLVASNGGHSYTSSGTTSVGANPKVPCFS